MSDQFFIKTVDGLREVKKDYIVKVALSYLRPRMGSVLNNLSAFKDYLRLKHGESSHETFGVVYVDAQLRVLNCDEFPGEVSEVIISPRKVLEGVVKSGASGVFIYHNHPSGHAEPSRADINFTAKLNELLNVIKVRLYDHILVTAEKTVSFNEENLI